MSNNPFGLGNNSQLTNNPFSANSAASRFPRIDGDASSPVPQQQQSQPQYQSQQQPLQGYGGQAGYQQPQPTGYFPQQQQQPQAFQPPPQQQQQPLFPAYGQPGPSSFIGSQPTGFQPQSAFGQQQQQQQQFQQQQQQQPGGFNAYAGGGNGVLPNDSNARFQSSNPSYASVADLDPYSSLAQLPWAQPTRPPGTNESSAPAPPQSPTSGSFGGGGSWNDDHPRSYVRDHKHELDSWRSEAWKEFGRSIDKLKDAWIGRKNLVIKAMEGYGTQWNPADAERVRELLQEADLNIDTIVASSFQLKEAEAGYRHSADSASKARVREALNAGLKALPEWPEPLQTNRGETVGYGANLPPQVLQQPMPQFQQQQQQPQPFQQQQQQPQFTSQQPFQGYQQQPQQPQYTGWGGAPQQQQQPSYQGYPRQW